VGHLTDRGFCQPDADEAAAVEARKKKEELDKEIDKVKREYDEKQKLKREKHKGKEKEKDKSKEKESKSKEEDEDKDDEKAKDDKVSQFSRRHLHAAHSNPRLRSSRRQRKNLRPNSDLAYIIYTSKYY
jgi:hypothetical protein